VIAYYTGDAKVIDTYAVDKLSHIIFSFCHLKDGKLSVDKSQDSLTIKHLVSLKKQNPKLKIMLSLGGWGGCEPCSEGFSTLPARKKFAKSVKQLNDYFGTDGIDLDWEYPTIEGHPGHLYQPADYDNFTSLVKELRKALGKKHEISFAAGGFQTFLDKSVDWKKVMPMVDRVNIMNYDLVNGYATVTGHHTPVYSQHEKEESTDRAVSYLINLGIPASKQVIGAAFYARVWKDVAATNNGLYQAGVHTNGVDYRDFDKVLTPENGWKYFWDEKANAPFWYNAAEKKFATADDKESVKRKTQYAKDKKLGGVMFWELTLDKTSNGLLQAISDAK
jgi:chitinase